MPLRTRIAFVCALGIVLWRPINAPAATSFVRGDIDRNGQLQVADALQLLRNLFPTRRQVLPIKCFDSADINDDGKLNVTDAIYLLLRLFSGGPVPPPPFERCGPDPTEDALGCDSFDFCPSERSFYGLPVEEDGVFFVIDRSPIGGGSSALMVASQEMLRFTYVMKPETKFAVAFFDKALLKFPSGNTPASADVPAMVESFRAFVQSTSGGSGTCGQPALFAALDFAKASASERKRIFYVSDGGGTCPGNDNEEEYLRKTVEAVTAANAGTAVIDTIGVSATGLPEKYLRDLAEMNGGTYTPAPR